MLGVASFKDAGPEDMKRFLPGLDHPQRVQVRSLDMTIHLRVPAALVVEASGIKCLYTDGEQTGNFTAKQRFCLEPLTTKSNYADAASFDLPLATASFKKLPVIVHTLRPSDDAMSKGITLLFSNHILTEGTLTLSGKPVKIAYQVDLDKALVDPKSANTYVDEDGDGEFDAVRERKFGQGAAPTFHVGSKYISTDSVNFSTRRAVLSTRDPGQYRQYDYAKGSILPDFAFIDFDGRSRLLSSVKGRLVLLDFWATWCEACVADLPKKKAVYERLHAQGLEILGIDGDGDSVHKPKAMVEKLGLPWPEARFDSDLIQQRFQIGIWPTAILIDDQRRVLSTNLSELSGDELEKTVMSDLKR